MAIQSLPWIPKLAIIRFLQIVKRRCLLETEFLGCLSAWRAVPLDRGHRLSSCWQHCVGNLRQKPALPRWHRPTSGRWTERQRPRGLEGRLLRGAYSHGPAATCGRIGGSAEMGEAAGAANAPAAGSHPQDGAHVCTQGRGPLAVLRSCPLVLSPQQGDQGRVRTIGSNLHILRMKRRAETQGRGVPGNPTRPNPASSILGTTQTGSGHRTPRHTTLLWCHPQALFVKVPGLLRPHSKCFPEPSAMPPHTP